jgi:hypothetical protein
MPNRTAARAPRPVVHLTTERVVAIKRVPLLLANVKTATQFAKAVLSARNLAAKAAQGEVPPGTPSRLVVHAVEDPNEHVVLVRAEVTWGDAMEAEIQAETEVIKRQIAALQSVR